MTADPVPREPARMTPQLALATLLLVASFLVFTLATVPQLTFPYELNYGEGVLLDQARRVTEPAGLYPPFEQAPYVIDNYPPVYPLLVGLLPGLETAPFFTARLISLLATLVAAFMVALIVRRWSGDVAALTGAAVFLSLPQINDFAEFARIDSLALCLGLVGMYCTLRDDHPRWRWIGCAAFFFSIYTRHSSIALPLATFFILWRTEGRKSLVWPFGLLAAGAAAYVGLHLWTGGRIYEHLIHFNVLDYSWMHDPLAQPPTPPGTMEKWFGGFYPMGYLLVTASFLAFVPLNMVGKVQWNLHARATALLFLGAVGFLVVVYAKSIAHGRWGVPPTHFLEGGKYVAGWNLYYNLASFHVAMAVAALLAAWRWWHGKGEAYGALVLFGMASALMIGRAGSDTNYLFELSAVLTIAAAASLGRGPAWLRSTAAVLLVVTVASNVYLLEWSQGGEGARDSRPSRIREIGGAHSKILQALSQFDGPILADNPSFAAILGKEMHYQPFMYRQLREAQVWDPEGLHSAIRDQYFDAVVISAISALVDPTDPAGQVIWVAAPSSYMEDTRERWLKRYYKPSGVAAYEIITQATSFHWQVWVRRDQ
ncbi:MAG: glycosyltransferase family 39 protein [Planctomycetota bacterium]